MWLRGRGEFRGKGEGREGAALLVGGSRCTPIERYFQQQRATPRPAPPLLSTLHASLLLLLAPRRPGVESLVECVRRAECRLEVVDWRQGVLVLVAAAVREVVAAGIGIEIEIERLEVRTLTVP